MSLAYLLYRCPVCGADPVEGDRDRVHCETCDTRFARGGPPAGIVVDRPGAGRDEVPASELTRAIEEAGGPFPAARHGDGSIGYETEVVARRGTVEDPLRHAGRLLGFVEGLGDGSRGTLRIDDEAMVLLPREGGPPSRWPLLELRAVQTSSSSLQIRTSAEPLVHFGFLDDSPLRWQALVHGLLRRAYREAGRGEIVEFQPRIGVR